MNKLPHPDSSDLTVNCAIITVSDTRTEETDRSGNLIKNLLLDAGHAVGAYAIVKDEPAQIQQQMQLLSGRSDLQAMIFNG
ncbi:MAG TPA: molybdopterin-binding protein, partial [Phormidium sp.]